MKWNDQTCCGLMIFGAIEYSRHYVGWWPVTCSSLSHYLNPCWLSVSGAQIGTNFSDTLIEIEICSFAEVHQKISMVKCLSCCLSHNMCWYSCNLILRPLGHIFHITGSLLGQAQHSNEASTRSDVAIQWSNHFWFCLKLYVTRLFS